MRAIVASRLLRRGIDVISKTQAQKLLYCCYGIVLAAFDERLTDEHPKAWPGGPIFPRALIVDNGHRLTTDMAERFIDS